MANTPLPDGPPVSILVPARNEEVNISGCLQDLLAQEYPRFEVIAIDDNSTDRTGELIAAAAREDRRVLTLTATPTPGGWTGKNWALHLGAEKASGEWLLFTDADTRHRPHTLSSVVAHSIEGKLDFLSLLPHSLARRFWERVLQPVAMGYLLASFPLDRVNDPRRSEAFANGQFILIRREAYEALGGHAAVRGAYLEDIALARAAKAKGLRLECALGQRRFGVRMYDSLRRFFRGWRRIYLHAFDRRPGVLLLKALELLTISTLPYVLLVSFMALFLSGREASVFFLTLMAGPFLAVAMASLFAGKVQSTVGGHGALAIFHPLAALVLVTVLLDAARHAVTGAPTHWR